jgi:hypothetical protein
MRIIAVILLLVVEVALSGCIPLLLVLHGFCKLVRLEYFAEALARLHEREYAEARLERLRDKTADEVKHSIIDDVRFEIIACAYALRFQFRLRELYHGASENVPDVVVEEYSEETLLADLEDFFKLVERRSAVDGMDPELACEVYLELLQQRLERAQAEYEQALNRYHGSCATELHV